MAIQAKDPGAMRSALAPNARLVLNIAGVYSPELHAFPDGTQWNRDEIINMELGFQKDLKGPFAIKILSIIGEGDLVAAEVSGEGIRASTGRRYLQHYSYHFQVNSGRITEGRLYEDTFHYWDVWNNRSSPARPPYKETPLAQKVPAMGNETPTESTAKDNAQQNDLNKEKVRSALMAIPRRDAALTRALWGADSVWSFAVGGDYSPQLRAFQGAPRWDREAMISMQQASQKDFKEPYTLDIYSLIGEGDEVSAEAVAFCVLSNGRAYRQHYSVHVKLHNGSPVEGHVYQDTLHQYDLSLEHALYAPVPSPIAP